MVEEKLTDQDMTYVYNQVAVDSTRWDKMTGTVLKHRITAYQSSTHSFEKAVDLISCLRLAEIYYLRRKEGNSWQVPMIDTPDGNMLFLFTAKTQAKNEKYKAYELDSGRYPDIIKSFADKPKSIVLNPDTQLLPLPTEFIDNLIKVFDEFEDDLDKAMAEGISDKDICPLMFERFWGRKVDCKTKNGHYIGDAGVFNNKQPKNPYLEVEIDADNKVRIFYDEVLSIKDITTAENK